MPGSFVDDVCPTDRLPEPVAVTYETVSVTDPVTGLVFKVAAYPLRKVEG